MNGDRTVLDWRDSRHWSRKKGACVYCSAPTNLRDETGRPAMKTCAENALNDEEASRTDSKT